MSAFWKRQLTTNKHRPAIASLGLVTKKLDVAGKELLRWEIEVGIVVAASALVSAWKRALRSSVSGD